MHKITMKLGTQEIWPASIALVTALFFLSGCTGGRVAYINYLVPTGGASSPGARVIQSKDCGSCHTIPGIRGANGSVGPPLTLFARRTFIAGEIPNTPANLALWVRTPQTVEPKTAMPNLGLSEQQARDVAAYLYTLR